MEIRGLTQYYSDHFLIPQPVADKPFTFETELDDLPKEKLKGDDSSVLTVHECNRCLFSLTELIFDETIKFVSIKSNA